MMQKFNEYVQINDSVFEQEIITLYNNGKQPIKIISKQTGASIGKIYRTLEKYGIKPHRNNKKDLHDLVRQYYISGTPKKKIAELLGITVRYVTYLCSII